MRSKINDFGVSLLFLTNKVLCSDAPDESNSMSGGPGGPTPTVTISHSDNHTA